jgi:hypothetical protein
MDHSHFDALDAPNRYPLVSFRPRPARPLVRERLLSSWPVLRRARATRAEGPRLHSASGLLLGSNCVRDDGPNGDCTVANRGSCSEPSEYVLPQ